MPVSSQVSLAHTLSHITTGTSNSPSEQIYIIFVNGLGLPQANWQPAIDTVKNTLLKDGLQNRNCRLTFLTYDRPGQGLSQPPEVPKPEKHDITSSVEELHDMITTFFPRPNNNSSSKHTTSNANNSTEPESKPNINIQTRTKTMLVAHSIGVPLARLYINRNPGTITALLALDSNMANSDFISIFPDPDSPSFNADRDLPPDTTIDLLRWTRSNYARMFHPSVTNPENLDRSNLASLLPDSSAPVLIGPDGQQQPVLLGVVAHDPVRFAIESLKISTKGLTQMYMEPCWKRYNEGLLQIGRTNGDGIVVADGAGHFVQRDNPQCVAEEILKMLRRLRSC